MQFDQMYNPSFTQPPQNWYGSPNTLITCPHCGRPYEPAPQAQSGATMGETPQLDLFLPAYVRESGF